MRSFPTRISSNLPVLVKPGRIVPQLVNQHGFTSPYDLNKHKKKRELRRATPVRGTSRGLDDPSVRRSGFRRRKTTRTSESDENLHVSLAYVCECGERLVYVLACVPLACMRSNLEAKVPDPYKGESPRRGETG